MASSASSSVSPPSPSSSPSSSHWGLLNTTVFQVTYGGSSKHYKNYYINICHLAAAFRQEHLHQSASALSGPIQMITFDEPINVNQLDVYAQYLKHGEVATTSELDDDSPSPLAMSLERSLKCFEEIQEPYTTPAQAKQDYINLIRCYHLGDVLLDRKFQDAVATKFISVLRSPGTHQSALIELLNIRGVQAVVNCHGPDSPIFKLLVSAYARFASAQQMAHFAFMDYNGDFKCKILKQMALLRATQRMDGAPAGDFAVGPCRFHTHGFYDVCLQRKQGKTMQSMTDDKGNE